MTKVSPMPSQMRSCEIWEEFDRTDPEAGHGNPACPSCGHPKGSHAVGSSGCYYTLENGQQCPCTVSRHDIR